jgi:hypothetical protein
MWVGASALLTIGVKGLEILRRANHQFFELPLGNVRAGVPGASAQGQNARFSEPRISPTVFRFGEPEDARRREERHLAVSADIQNLGRRWAFRVL